MTWRSFSEWGCPGAHKRWRYLANGSIEIEGQGVPVLPWPASIEPWRPLIEAAAERHALPAAWIAAIMAIETQGKNICLDANNPSKICSGTGCSCVPNEGAGLMATLPSTASLVLGRGVTSNDLLRDPSLAIEAGTRYLKQTLAKYGNDFVAAAVAYNAGSIRCGRGGVFIPAGQSWPKQACPDTGWGVVMGCTYASQPGAACQPSGPGAPHPYICSNLYPEKAIAAQNTARQHFGSTSIASAMGIGAAGAALLAGIAAGWFYLGDKVTAST